MPEDVIDNLIRVCHSDSYDKLDNNIKVSVSVQCRLTPWNPAGQNVSYSGYELDESNFFDVFYVKQLKV